MTLIKGGTVVTPSGVGEFDIWISGETIQAVTEPGALPAGDEKVIDATGRLVVPGGIEPHAHIGGPRQPERSGAEPVSKAAVWGGTTTVLDFATQVPGHDLRHALGEAAERWEGNAYTDYSYHPIFTNGASRGHINQIPELVEEGFPSFKVFTTSIRPPSPQMQNNKTDFGRLGIIMERVTESGGILLVHSEDDDMVHYNYDNAKEDGLWDWWHMHHIHSNLSEDVSFRRVLRLASKTGCPIYFVHVSAHEGLEAVEQARMEGKPVYGETLHNYACFNQENYREDFGMKYHTYPSLKFEEDRGSLWQGLLDGRLSTLATDLVSTTWEEKTRFKTVADVTGGHNGIETRMGIAYSVGVVELGMSLEGSLTSHRRTLPRYLACIPKKGVIAPGSDADICIMDTTWDRPLTLDDLHLEDYSIWEGWHIYGWPETVILRGNVMIENRDLKGSPDTGQWLSRSIPSEVLQKPIC